VVLAASIIWAASTSETSVNFYQTTQRNIPEGSHLHSLFKLKTMLTDFHKAWCECYTMEGHLNLVPSDSYNQ
jgi:hypothetical protein